jgi:hypothetical protein
MSAVKEISISQVEFERNHKRNKIKIEARIGSKKQICSLDGTEFAREMSSITSLTEDEIRRRACYSLSSNSLPLDEILGEHKVTDNWISRNF